MGGALIQWGPGVATHQGLRLAGLTFGGLNGIRGAGSRSAARDGRAGRRVQNAQEGSWQFLARQRSQARQNSASYRCE